MVMLLPVLAAAAGFGIFWLLGKLFPEWEYKPRLGIAFGVAGILFLIWMANLDSLL